MPMTALPQIMAVVIATITVASPLYTSFKMAEPRRIVLADPLAGPSTAHTRFAVAGQGAPGAPGDVKMYEWDGEVS